jgi:phosphate starvation-inducible protein PhoH and related proteins
LTEKKITLENISPLQLYGINDHHLVLIRNKFQNLKIVARGETIKYSGDEQEMLQFELAINRMLDYLEKFGNISINAVEQIIDSNSISTKKNNSHLENINAGTDVLVFGNNGLIIKARTENQAKMVEAINSNDMVFAIGPAGTGKTYTAVALAVRALKNKEIKKIVLTRPAVEAGENLGFLPGDLKDKLDPYLQPLYDALGDMIPAERLSYYIENRIIQIAPLAFMRGRTLDNAFVILDEAQNATEAQLKMFLTRMGVSAKFIITGDLTQIDLPKHQPSGLLQATKLLSNVKGINVIELNGSDVIRHKLVRAILEQYEKK